MPFIITLQEGQLSAYWQISGKEKERERKGLERERERSKIIMRKNINGKRNKVMFSKTENS